MIQMLDNDLEMAAGREFMSQPDLLDQPDIPGDPSPVLIQPETKPEITQDVEMREEDEEVENLSTASVNSSPSVSLILTPDPEPTGAGILDRTGSSLFDGPTPAISPVPTPFLDAPSSPVKDRGTPSPDV
jgi:hypothetical protein